MRATHVWPALPAALAVLILWGSAFGQPLSPTRQVENPYPYREDEPQANTFSPAKGAAYLDGVARFWMRPNSCGACHANFAYLIARPLLSDGPASQVAQTRAFLERRKQTHPEFSFHAESVGIAFALAWDDARTGGGLRPTTRQALRRMWSLQHRPSGTWYQLGCGELVPSENDRHYTAALAALAVGIAPEGYVRSAEAQDGLIRLRRYFAKQPARNLHQKALTLWASLYLDGLMTRAEREEVVKSLLNRQRPDGGWNLATLGAAFTRPARPTVEGAPSDGYGTGLAVYVLRQAGVPADHPRLVRGAAWLRANQRASGRWFTPTHTAGHQTEGGVGARDLYVQNLGTAFAVLALEACEGLGTNRRPVSLSPSQAGPGLSLRGRLLAGY
jgi:squalene-hopene/tetraprenyl-beta-curcumene cyclase